ncbi:MAG TPA: choice-of-anchor tandem repeat GloVer-containing protein [Verrucomicrobiae bacterium]
MPVSLKTPLTILAAISMLIGLFQATDSRAAGQLYLAFTNVDTNFVPGTVYGPSIVRTALVFGSDGATLYGISQNYGSTNRGCIFSFREDGSGFQVLHLFTTNANDGNMSTAGIPSSSLITDNGNIGGLALANNGWLYGTSPTGGTNNEGTVYRIRQDGTGFQVLHSFGNQDTSFPCAPVIQGADGALYGTCFVGEIPGSPYNGGAVYKINTDGSGYSALGYATNCFIASGLVQGTDSQLYGNASGALLALFFRIATNGSAIIPIYTNSPGATPEPLGTMIQIGAYLYGTTCFAGTSSAGTVYMLETNGANYQVLHNFNDGTVANDGQHPGSGLVYAGGYLYGTTSSGGPAQTGTIYMMDTAGDYYSSIYDFPALTGGLPQTQPLAALTPGIFEPGGGSGALFGTYVNTTTGPGGIFGLLINPVATITAASVSFGGQTLVSWPAWAVGYRLQATTNLTSGTWTTVTNATPVLSEQVPTANSGTTFYRLVSP